MRLCGPFFDPPLKAWRFIAGHESTCQSNKVTNKHACSPAACCNANNKSLIILSSRSRSPRSSVTHEAVTFLIFPHRPVLTLFATTSTPHDKDTTHQSPSNHPALTLLHEYNDVEPTNKPTNQMRCLPITLTPQESQSGSVSPTQRPTVPPPLPPNLTLTKLRRPDRARVPNPPGWGWPRLIQG